MSRRLVFVLCLLFGSAAFARVDVKAVDKPKALFELKLKYMYAIGKAEDGDAPITVLNGRVYVLRSSPGGETTIEDSMKTRTSSLLVTHVKNWTEAQLAGEARTPANLGPFMNTVLKKTGYELPGVFPFLIKGTFTAIVVEKESFKKISGILVGFLTKTLPTDHGSAQFKMDMHFVDDGGKRVGRVSDFAINADSKATLFLPE